METALHRPEIQQIPANIRKLLGPPPLLPIDSEEDYYATMAGIAATVKPHNDVLVWFSIKDLVDARFEIVLYTRVRALLIIEAETDQTTRSNAYAKALLANESDDEDADYLTMLLAERERRQLKQTSETDPPPCVDDVDTKPTQASETDLPPCDDSMGTTPTLRSIAAAWRGWTLSVGQVDRLLTSANRRYHKALDELERHQLRLYVWPESARPASAARQGARRLLPAPASGGVGQRRRARNR